MHFGAALEIEVIVCRCVPRKRRRIAYDPWRSKSTWFLCRCLCVLEALDVSCRSCYKLDRFVFYSPNKEQTCEVNRSRRKSAWGSDGKESRQASGDFQRRQT